MAEATTPATGVQQAAPSIESRLTALFAREEQQAVPDPGQKPPPAEPEAKPEPQEATPGTDELTPEDIPDDEAPAAQPDSADAFEIVHNGQQVKLSREETIKMAQRGFDYTQKTQALAEKSKMIDRLVQRATEMDQIAPLLAKEHAEVTAIKSQLDQLQNVDWVQLATEQPLEYPRYRAQYDILVNSFNAGVRRLTEANNAVMQRRQEIAAVTLQQEGQRMRELIPEWQTPAKYHAESAQLKSYLLAQGATQEAVDGLSDALAVAIARKAMLYDKLLKSKGEKQKLLQTAPPVARPGVNPGRDAAMADKDMELRQRLKKTGRLDDVTALLLNRERRR